MRVNVHSTGIDGGSKKQSHFSRTVLRRVSRILWFSPFLFFLPIFFVVSDLIPDQNHGSIADGFRKMNVLFAVMVPFSLCSWGIAFALTAVNDFSDIPRSRIMLWGVLAAAFVIVITIVCGVDL